MKVCMVTTGPINGPGGVENVAANISSKLEGMGIDVCAVNAYEKYSNPIKSFMAFRKIPKLVDKTGADIIHTHDNSGYFIAKSGRKYVHTSHGTWKNIFSHSDIGLQDRLFSGRIVNIERFIVSRASSNIAVSSFVKNSVKTQYGIKKKINVVHNGVDTTLFRPSHRPAGRTAVWVGTNPKLKGLEIAKRAAADAGLKLKIVGVHGKNSSEATYLGRIMPSKMPRVYNGADVFVFPSFYESYPVAPLEAMASGLPIVVSEDSHVEIIRDGKEGFVVKSHNPEDYANCLEKVMRKRKTLGNNARKTAKKYDWSKQAKIYAKLYDDME